MPPSHPTLRPPRRPCLSQGRTCSVVWGVLCGIFALALTPERMLQAAAAFETASEVVIVRSTDVAPYATAADAIQKKLAQPGRSISTADLNQLSDSDEAGYKAILAADKAKLYVAIGSQAAEWLHARLPAEAMLMYCMVADPESRGLTQGRPAYGISTTIAWTEQYGVIQRALPLAKRIGILYAKKDTGSKAAMKALKGQLGAGFELIAFAVEEYESVSDAIQALMNAKPDVVWTSPDSAVYSPATVRALLLLALRHKTPVYGFSTPFVRAGALFGVGIDPDQQGKQCGDLCLSFLEAIKTGRLDAFLKRTRVVAPRYQIAVNQIVAKQLERTLPDEFTAKADVVYKPD
ncbi:MAG TPA: ABC transporter substrate binding protein [Planctomycetota bacterium]|nr:ABC transporter substrate binding protein [Planctomycetota bacterium]